MKNHYSGNNLSRKRYQTQRYKNKIKRKAEIDCSPYTGGYVIKNKGTSRERVVRYGLYKRKSGSIRTTKYFRRLSNKKIRKLNHFITENMNYSSYKKIFDYWWMID